MQELGEGEGQVDHWAGAWRRAGSHNPEIMTWTETKSQMPNQLSHPVAPREDEI